MALHPGLSMADAIQLAGAVAVEALGGPHIPIRLGRRDIRVPPPSARLPTYDTCETQPMRPRNPLGAEFGRPPSVHSAAGMERGTCCGSGCAARFPPTTGLPPCPRLRLQPRTWRAARLLPADGAECAPGCGPVWRSPLWALLELSQGLGRGAKAGHLARMGGNVIVRVCPGAAPMPVMLRRASRTAGGLDARAIGPFSGSPQVHRPLLPSQLA